MGVKLPVHSPQKILPQFPMVPYLLLGQESIQPALAYLLVETFLFYTE